MHIIITYYVFWIYEIIVCPVYPVVLFIVNSPNNFHQLKNVNLKQKPWMI